MIISITGSTTAISSPSALVVRSTTTRMTLAGLGSQHALVGSGFMFAATTTENPRSAKWLSSSIDEPGKPTSMSGRVKWSRTRTVTLPPPGGESEATQSCSTRLFVRSFSATRADWLYRSGRSAHWAKVKNPKAPAITHEARRIPAPNGWPIRGKIFSKGPE